MGWTDAMTCAGCGKTGCTCQIYQPGDLHQGEITDALACAGCGKPVCSCQVYQPGDLTPNPGKSRGKTGGGGR